MESTGKTAYPFFSIKKHGIYLKILVQPGSKKDSIVGVQEEFLKIKLSSPPVEGKANKSLIEFLSKTFGIKKSSMTIEKGLSSRKKTVRIEGMVSKDMEDVLDISGVFITKKRG